MNELLRIGARHARGQISAGGLRGPALLERILAIPFLDRDAWVDELLGIEELPSDVPGLPREAVPYLPCGVEEILAAIREAPVRAEDEFVDLGSGMGRVALLAHLLTGARASGVELQEPLVRSASALTSQLGLESVAFVQADAAASELNGSIFFLYAPFSGDMLTQVVQRLKEVAAGRRITVCAVSLELQDVTWLRPRQTSCVSLTIYDSR